MKYSKYLALVILTFAVLSGNARAADNIQSVGAVGYDVVSYFTDAKAVKGTTENALNFYGTTYLFSSKEHQDAFVADPAKYLPQYGGYCAYGMSLSKKFPVDPEAWKIVDGKLYLNLSKAVQTRWQEDIPGNIAKANANWPKVKDVAPDQL